MGEYKNQDKTGEKGQQDDKAFGQFDKDRQQQQGETKKQDEFADAQQGDKQIRKDQDNQQR